MYVFVYIYKKKLRDTFDFYGPKGILELFLLHFNIMCM